MNIVLVGFMGAGKTAAGKLVAEKLGYDFLDTDELVEKRLKQPVRDIFWTIGEEGFRQIEREMVRTVANADRCVVATGGGTLGDPDNASDLKRNGCLVWLKVNPDTILSRLEQISTRPLIDPGNPHGSITRLMMKRQDLYRKMAKIHIDTDNLTADQVAEQIVAAVHREWAKKTPAPDPKDSTRPRFEKYH